MKTGKTMGDIVHIMQYIMHICPSFQFEVGGHKLKKMLKIREKMSFLLEFINKNCNQSEIEKKH